MTLQLTINKLRRMLAGHNNQIYNVGTDSVCSFSQSFCFTASYILDLFVRGDPKSRGPARADLPVPELLRPFCRDLRFTILFLLLF